MPKLLYLTIDDSPSPDFARKVRFLRERQIPAVFFCRGDLLARQAPLAVWALRQGATLANHAYTHPHFSDLPVAAGRAEIQQTDALLHRLHEAAGVPWAHKYFRFPYGDQGDLRRGLLLQPDAAIPGLTARRRWRWRHQLGAVLWPVRQAALAARLAAAGQARKQQLQQCLAELGYRGLDFAPAVRYEYLQAYAGLDWPWTFDALEWATRHPRPPGGIGTAAQVLARLGQPNPPDLRGPVPELAWGLPAAHSAEVLLLHDFADTAPLFYAVLRRLLAQGAVFGAMPGPRWAAAPPGPCAAW